MMAVRIETAERRDTVKVTPRKLATVLIKRVMERKVQMINFSILDYQDPSIHSPVH